MTLLVAIPIVRFIHDFAKQPRSKLLTDDGCSKIDRGYVNTHDNAMPLLDNDNWSAFNLDVILLTSVIQNRHERNMCRIKITLNPLSDSRSPAITAGHYYYGS